MVFCNVSSTILEAVADMDNFISNNDKFDMIKKIDVFNLTILDKKGNKHMFMSQEWYEKWCKGRTYVKGGAIYHSGVYIKEWEGEEILNYREVENKK